MAPDTIGVGDRVLLHSLQAAQFNGLSGIVHTSLIQGRHRVNVEGPDGSHKSARFKPENLTLQQRAPPPGPVRPGDDRPRDAKGDLNFGDDPDNPARPDLGSRTDADEMRNFAAQLKAEAHNQGIDTNRLDTDMGAQPTPCPPFFSCLSRGILRARAGIYVIATSLAPAARVNFLATANLKLILNLVVHGQPEAPLTVTTTTAEMRIQLAAIFEMANDHRGCEYGGRGQGSHVKTDDPRAGFAQGDMGERADRSQRD